MQIGVQSPSRTLLARIELKGWSGYLPLISRGDAGSTKGCAVPSSSSPMHVYP